MVIVSGKSWSSSLNERLKVLPLGLLSYDMTLNSELGFRPARKLSVEVAFACIFFFESSLEGMRLSRKTVD